MRHIFVFFINLANKHAQTNTNNYSKYHKISQKFHTKVNYFIFEFLGVIIILGKNHVLTKPMLNTPKLVNNYANPLIYTQIIFIILTTIISNSA